MTITIQPLNRFGQSVGNPIISDWVRFLNANDGFSLEQAADIHATLKMGANYLLGANLGEYRLTMVK